MSIVIPPLNMKDRPKILKNAVVVYQNARKSVTAFCTYFDDTKIGRGATTDQEQDILRAMLLFATAGLDAVAKQLIKDVLPEVIMKDIGAHTEFEKFLERRIRKGSVDVEPGKKDSLDIKFLSKVLASRKPRQIVIDDLLRTLTGDSLQSKEQLLKVAAHFAITAKEIVQDQKLVKTIFEVRNQIAHEMDINLGARNRNRWPRKYEDMTGYACEILSVARKFVLAVNSKIA